MFHITATTKSYELRIVPIPENSGQPDLRIILEQTGPGPNPVGHIIEARMTATCLIAWLMCQVLQQDLLGNVPGVTILRSPSTPEKGGCDSRTPCHNP